MKKIVVSLDNSIIKTKIFYESLCFCITEHPLQIFRFLFWLIRGVHYFKRKIVQLYQFNPKFLPYNNKLLEYLKSKKQEGYEIILISEENKTVVDKISSFLCLFDDVYASSDDLMLDNKKLVKFINEKFGSNNYEYVGDLSSCMDFFEDANSVVCVNVSEKDRYKYNTSETKFSFITKENQISMAKRIIKTLRVHQWSKNLLLFVPLITANLLTDLCSWVSLFIAFFSFSFLASFVYVLNDLLDLESDRKHPTKRFRMFASGTVSVKSGLLVMPFLLFIAILLATTQNVLFFYCLLIYFIVTTLYSFYLKKIVIIDCLTLAFLYTFRMISGIVVLNVSTSLWLISFSGFFFLSLAFVKRIAELKNVEKTQKQINEKRGYKICDIPLLFHLGVASGYVSTLIFALYVNSNRISLFNHPKFVYFCGPILVFWVSYIFFKTNRGEMDEDPVLFAIKNRTSLVSGILFCILFVCGVI
jgi:4-hydroxybenzoate polyprenyltransferase